MKQIMDLASQYKLKNETESGNTQVNAASEEED